jgi:glycosyltransferase involved in cell wall biosynthesis
MSPQRMSRARIAFIGNHLPRQCGIATFTTDLCQAIAREYEQTTCLVVAINDIPNGYRYPSRVWFEIAEQDIAAYRQAADFLNFNNVDLVCLQHEYGIFGGPAGSHILALLRELRMPVVTTLHTVLREPNPHQRIVMEELAQLSDRLIVMSQRAVSFLQEIYHVPADKIDMIHHGIPDFAFIDPNFYKDQFGVEGKKVLLTFGLISPNKGIEYVIEALPAIRRRHPDVVYIVLGATHPHVKRREGEDYRLRLQRLARELGVENHVIFHNRFVRLEELMEFIGAADIYLTPYLNPEQIVSGTLAYTLGAGKAVISTPYWYAEELLADGRGMLVPFRNSQAIAETVIEMLDNEVVRHTMRKRAYQFGREMIWSTVAHRYMESFERAHHDRVLHPRPAFVARTMGQEMGELPTLKLDHLYRLTDNTGILQHAVFTVPNYDEGYTTDDNARALLVAVLLEEMEGGSSEEAGRLGARYLAFLWHAFNTQSGRFRNFAAFNREWQEEVGSEDSHGRALWALGSLLGRSMDDGLHGAANRLFHMALPAALEFTSPRAWAFILIGLHDYLRRIPGDRIAQNVLETLSERLWKLYQDHATPDWPWCEEIVSYCNAHLAQALLLWGIYTDRAEIIQQALRSLEWLAEVQCAPEGHFVPIGNHGFYRRGGERARFDQQPVEAHAMVAACLTAYRATGDDRWYAEARRAFEWFLGRNDLHLPLYDPVSGGCRDGLHPDRANENQGAEATLSFLLSLMEMSLAKRLLEPLPGAPYDHRVIRIGHGR